MHRPTVKDIAREAGVSRGAVSFALNDRPGVSEATRQRVKDVAARLGWTPNIAARALSANRAHAVGLVIARPRDSITDESFYLKLIAGVDQVLTPRSTSLLLQLADDIDHEVAVYRQWWSERRVDGVIVSDPRVDDPRLAVLAELGLPATLVGSSDGSVSPDPAEQPVLSSVSIDDAAAMAVIVEHLASLGHRRVAHVSGSPDLVHIEARVRAFREVARGLGLATETVPTDFSEDAGAAATSELLARPDRATAIVYDNELLALSGMTVINAADLRIPSDVAVVSWEDSPVCRVVSPPLTTLARDAVQLGHRAAELLVDVVERAQVDHVLLEAPTLVPRGSTVGSAPQR